MSEAATNPSLQYYDTTAHNVTMGPTYTLDGGDSLFLKFNYLSADQSSSSGLTPPIKFTAQSIQPEYVAKFVRGWTATISGGATIVEQGSSHTFASGSVSLMNELDRQTRVEIAVSRLVAPLYIGIGGAMISNVAQVYVSHSFTRVVQLTVNGNYAHNESAPVKLFTFESIKGSAVLDYKLTRSTKLSLSQDYGHFLWSGSPSFDRFVTMLAVSTEW